MQRSSKIILIVVAVVIVLIAGFKYDQYMVRKDFMMVSLIPCTPEEGTCFVRDCGGIASAVAGCDGAPYKKILLHASYMPPCLEDQDCPEDMPCPAGDTSCSFIFCSDETLDEDESCLEEGSSPE